MKTYEIRALFQFFDTDCSGTISKAGKANHISPSRHVSHRQPITAVPPATSSIT